MKQKKETTPEEMQDFMKGFLKSSGTHPMSSKDQMEALFEEAMQDESDEQFILPANLPAGTPAQQQDRLPAEQLDGLHDSQPAEVLEAPVVSRRISSKQRKASLEEYRDVFLQAPSIEDRKPVFLSHKLRDRLDRIVRMFGDRRMSVSGMVENIVKHHLSVYEEDIEAWRKL